MLEMLTLGVLWLRYSDDGIVLNKISKDVLTGLVEMRQKGRSLKPGADFFRGILGTFVLYSEHRYGYEVLIIPHESAAFSDNSIKEGELGIIGIACVTNLLAGGWKAKALGIPAQCVLLDYCGCRNHWDEEGFSTAIDRTQLCKIMDIFNKE